MGVRRSRSRLHDPRKRSEPLALAAAILIMLTGCTLGPAYKRPETPLPTAWRDASVSEPAAWPSADWWHGFGSNELDGYIRQAEQANNDIAAAVARVRQADALATIAGAALLPTVGAGVTTLTERQQSTGGVYSDFHQVSPQLTASYMVDFWGKNRAAQSAAIAIATASRRDRATVELTVMTSVALAYFSNLELQERVTVAEGNVAAAETTLKGLRLQLAAGIATALDVAQQETTVATLSAAIPPLRQQLQQTIDALAILIGQPPESVIVSAAKLADLSVPVVKPGLPSELLERRPDVAEAEAQLIAANANIAVARAALFPSIELTASGGFASSSLSTLLRSSSRVYSAAAGLTQPIFEGGALRAQVEFAQARRDELVANYRKAIISALANVEDALVAMQQSAEQVSRQQTAVARAQRAYRIAQAQLHAGTVSILTVLNTETALFSAQDALVLAKLAQMQSLVNLFGALGGGWREEARQ
jgi:NodT family efflux transporter outer membrane factor (OMF) lipoprotein